MKKVNNVKVLAFTGVLVAMSIILTRVVAIPIGTSIRLTVGQTGDLACTCSDRCSWNRRFSWIYMSWTSYVLRNAVGSFVCPETGSDTASGRTEYAAGVLPL